MSGCRGKKFSLFLAAVVRRTYLRGVIKVLSMVTLSFKSGFSLLRRRDGEGVNKSGSCFICPSGISPEDGEPISPPDDKFIPTNITSLEVMRGQDTYKINGLEKINETLR